MKQTRKTLKSLLAMLMALMLVLCVMPISAFAAGSVSDNYDAVVSHIEANGTSDEETGVKYIEAYYESDGMTVGFVLMNHDEGIVFAAMMIGDDTQPIIVENGFLLEKTGSTVPVEFYAMVYSDEMYDEVVSSKNISRTSLTTTPAYTVTESGTYITSEMATELFNSTLQMLCAYWDEYLGENLNFGLQGLGFTSYDGYVCSHTYDNDCDTDCNSCGAMREASHSYGDWTEGEDGCQQVCAGCGDVQTAEHDWLLAPDSYDATCKEDGKQWYTCTVCGAEKEETLPKTDDHTFGNLTAVDDAYHKDTCSVCQKEITEAHTWGDGEITKPASCKEEGETTYVCTDCQHSKVEKIDKTNDHTFGNLTAVDDAYHKDTCSVCQEEITEKHTWDDGEITKPASCKEEGEMTYECTGCGHTKTEKIEKSTTHSYGDWQKISEDEHKHICSVCQKEESAKHTWDDGEITKPATCKEEGVKTITCTGCQHSYTEVIPLSTTHTWSKWEKVDADTHKRACSICELPETGNHGYKTSWSKDSQEHWHECAECKDKKDIADHTPGAEATETTPQTCTVCNYIIKAALGHDYAEAWTTDEIGHWHTCSRCEEKGEYADHDFENDCDPDCSICGYVREAGHSFGDEWTSDGENHWHACAGCDEVEGKEAHTPGAEATETTAQTCTLCGYEIAPALGVQQTEPAATDPAPTTPGDIDIVEKNDFPWWIIPVAVIVIGAALFFIFKKKK